MMPEEGEELREFCEARPDWCFVPLSSAGLVLSVGDVDSETGRRHVTEFCKTRFRQSTLFGNGE
ncbi:hypothetical protein CHS0354_034697 [Potamilus streckersoni]|uniref:Uncharacterized protein n=1 Tax=Potamilus streckersoni TaxID=2493646 RepID=A0AAE0WER7_9BIVA|nr:hypothetical protein CHS0354_034697 [Potamilus streckersoni]